MSVGTIDRLKTGGLGPPPLPAKPKTAPGNVDGKPSFAQHLQFESSKITSPVKISAHAEVRIAQRGIKISQHQMHRIGNAIESASSKGAKKALILVDEIALIVGVEKKTIITLADKENLKENVFTSIDSAVIA